ncbi:MAG: class I SAM-dependent methyltransferase [Variovorax sp.]|nr:MAG: class I SAM-dependent methyltransferase [Variovorax sp.]
MSRVTNAIKERLPAPIVNALHTYRRRSTLRAFAGLSTKDVFTKIYEDRVWGGVGDAEQKYFSGSGSRDTAVETYVNAVRKFVQSLDRKPDVVDLGCGDFHVGSRVRPLCARYVACDIVDSLITSNVEKYKALDVDFRTLDFTQDELPPGDVVFVRQVLQHLSNAEIARTVHKIPERYRYLVLTEHVPPEPFAHNLDKSPGPDNRLAIHSGIVLTSAPFNMAVREKTTLCEVQEWGGIIRTIVYRF